MFEDALNDAQRRGGHPRRRAAADRRRRRHGQDDDAGVVAWPGCSPQGVRPERLLLLTFSRRSAREMTSRAERIAAEHDVGVDASRIWSGTFHAVGNRLLRLHGRALGLDPVVHGARPGRRRRRDEPAPRRARLQRARAPLPAQGDARRHLLPHRERRREARRRAEAALPVVPRRGRRPPRDLRAPTPSASARSTCSTTTTCCCSGRRSRRRPRRARSSPTMFDHVLVDEYQDTNALQADILEGLRPEGTPRNLTVVGDDAQSIYGFRAATVRNILEFPTRFPGTAVVRLEQNYRSTPPILDSSNAVIALSPQRHEKTLWSARRGDLAPIAAHLPRRGRAVRRRVRERARPPRGGRAAQGAGGAVPRGAPQRPPRGRAHAAEHPVREVRRPEVHGGRPREGHARDPARAREPARRGGMVPRAAAARGHGPGDGAPADGGDRCSADRRRLARSPVPRRAGRGARRRRSTACRSCVRRCADAPTRRCSRPRPRSSGSERSSRPCSPGATTRRPRACATSTSSRRSPPGTRRGGRFLAELTLDPPSSTGDLAGPPLLDEDWLVLSTIHSAKGLEWDVVHVIHAADGMIPSDMATGDDDEIEEERRLLYVALTRARDALHVYRPHALLPQTEGRSALVLAALTLPRAVVGALDVRGDRPSHRRPRTRSSTSTGSGRRRRVPRRPLVGVRTAADSVERWTSGSNA